MAEHLVDFRDRKGRPLELRKWSRLWHDPAYRIVAQHQVGQWRIRTTWVGVTTVGHMFYTAISGDNGKTWRDVAYADTEIDAIQVHNRITHKQSTKDPS